MSGDWYRDKMDELYDYYKATAKDLKGWTGTPDFEWWHFVRLRHIPYYLTCEPIGCILYIGTYFLVTVQPQLFKVRFVEYYTAGLSDELTGEQYEEAIQTEMVEWNQYRFGANVVCAVVMITFLGAWSDRVGRQFNCMLGSAALGINIMSNVYMCSQWTLWAPWTYVLLGSVEGALGNYGGCFYAAQAYVVDLVIDADELSWRLNVVSFFRGAGATFGSYLTSIYAVDFGIVEWCCLGNVVLMVPFLWALIWIYMIPPYIMEDARKKMAIDIAGERQRVKTILETERRLTRAMTAISHQTDPSKIDRGSTTITDVPEVEHKKVNIREMCGMIGQQYVDAYHTFTRPRTGWKRLCIWLLTFMNFVANLAGNEATSVVGVYVTFAPLYWGPPELGAWQTNGLLIGMFGQILGIWLFKKVLNLRDTTVIFISIVTFGISQIPVAFPTDFNMYLSNYLGVFAAIQTPTMASLMCSYVEPEEAGRVLVAFGVMLYASVAAQNYILQFVYLATLHWFPGFIFLLVAGLCFLCGGLAVLIHFLQPPEERVYEVKKIVEEQTQKVIHEETHGQEQDGNLLTVPEA